MGVQKRNIVSLTLIQSLGTGRSNTTVHYCRQSLVVVGETKIPFYRFIGQSTVCPSKMYRLVKHTLTFSRSLTQILRNFKFSLLCLLRLKLLASFLTMEGS